MLSGVDCELVPDASEKAASFHRQHVVDVDGPNSHEGIQGPTYPRSMMPGVVQVLHLVSVQPLRQTAHVCPGFTAWSRRCPEPNEYVLPKLPSDASINSLKIKAETEPGLAFCFLTF